MLLYSNNSFWRFIDSISTKLVLFGLSGFYIFNILVYYFGMHSSDLSHYIGLLIPSVIVFMLCCARYFQLIITRKDLRKILILCSLAPLLALISFVTAFITHGPDINTNVFYLLQFGCYCLPAFIVGMDCAIYRKEKSLFKFFDLVALLYLPVGIILIAKLQISVSNQLAYSDEIGGMAFMTVAYAFLYPFMALCISSIINNNIFVHNWKANKGMALVFTAMKFMLILLISIVILATATRGAQVSALCFLMFLLVGSLVSFGKRILVRAIMLFGGVLLFVILVVTAIQPPFLQLSLAKIDVVIEGSRDGKLITSTTRHTDYEVLDAIINNEKTDIAPETLIMNREQLYYTAWKEYQNNPIIGMGPLGYVAKYGRYPHNVILELLSDYGTLGAIPILLIIALIATNLIHQATKDIWIGAMTIFLIGANLPLFFSGTFLAHSGFWFFLGYGGSILLQGYLNFHRMKSASLNE